MLPRSVTLALICCAALTCCKRVENKHHDVTAESSVGLRGPQPQVAPTPSVLPTQDESQPAAELRPAASVPSSQGAGPTAKDNEAPCPGWSVNAVGRAIGSLERFCQEFGPCPKDLLAAGSLGFFGALPTVEVFASGIIVAYGSPRDGRRFAFSRKGAFIGAAIWQEQTFGACGKKAIEYIGGAIPEPGETEQVLACGYVPGRNLLTEKACRCSRPADRAPLIGLDRGPTLRLSLDCLYELGAAGNLCQPTLEAQQGMPEAQASSPGCGWTKIASPLMGSDCVYDANGRLVEMRLGQRYVSSGFDEACRP